MGRKEQQKQENRKNRKKARIQKSHGNYKKLQKTGSSPPNLLRFKQNMINVLRNKQIDCSTTINHLQEFKHPKINDLLEQRIEKLKDSQSSQQQCINTHNQSGNKYYKQVYKLVQACDIILQVLDVRDPTSCRCFRLQHHIQSLGNKKIIMILNKIDLVPAQNAYAWQTYLRRQYPVVMFKANLQNQQKNFSTFQLYQKNIANNTHMAESLIHTPKTIGTDHLMELIKQLAKVDKNRQAVTVGLIGYPNVGKSSVINSLKRYKTCQVSSHPGCTKNLKQIKLDGQIKLMDCPGVIFQKNISRNQMILQNITRPQNDLFEVVDAILQKIPQQDIINLYKINHYQSTEEFLAQICKKSGKLHKGGAPDLQKGAKIIIEDWNCGKLKYFTIPPHVSKIQSRQNMIIQ